MTNGNQPKYDEQKLKEAFAAGEPVVFNEVSHDKIRQVVYEAAPQADRQQWHQLVAETLLQRSDSLPAAESSPSAHQSSAKQNPAPTR